MLDFKVFYTFIATRLGRHNGLKLYSISNSKKENIPPSRTSRWSGPSWLCLPFRVSASVLPQGKKKKLKGMSQRARRPKKPHFKYGTHSWMPFQFKESKNVIEVNCNAKSTWGLRQNSENVKVKLPTLHTLSITGDSAYSSGKCWDSVSKELKNRANQI